ncbi:MAG: hypothetical protein PGN34_22645 [Methylobacterium frigidaeris]
MGEIGRARKPEEGRAGSGPGAGGLRTGSSAGYLPLLPTAFIAACLAAGSMYWHEAPRRPPTHAAATTPPPLSADLFRDDGMYRVRAAYPVEFEQQFPLMMSAIPAPDAAAVPVLPMAEDRSAEERPLLRRPAAKRPRPAPALAGLRPPPRPEPPRRVALDDGPVPGERGRETGSGSAGGDLPEGISSLRLPGFAPVRQTVVEAVTAAGDGLSSAGNAMLGLIDRRR